MKLTPVRNTRLPRSEVVRRARVDACLVWQRQASTILRPERTDCQGPAGSGDLDADKGEENSTFDPLS
jgi:hypothetical protein